MPGSAKTRFTLPYFDQLSERCQPLCNFCDGSEGSGKLQNCLQARGYQKPRQFQPIDSSKLLKIESTTTISLSCPYLAKVHVSLRDAPKHQPCSFFNIFQKVLVFWGIPYVEEKSFILNFKNCCSDYFFYKLLFQIFL